MRGDLSVADANFEVGPNGTGPSNDLTTADFLDMDVTSTPTVTYDNVDNTPLCIRKNEGIRHNSYSYRLLNSIMN